METVLITPTVVAGELVYAHSLPMSPREALQGLFARKKMMVIAVNYCKN